MPRAEWSSAIRLLVSDLDGTLIYEHPDGGCRANARMGRALRELQDRGVTVCLASGRIHQAMLHIARDLGVRGPIVSCNGAQVWHPDQAGGSFIHHQPLDVEVAREVALFCEARGLQLNYYLEDGIHARRFEPYWDIYHGRTAAPMHAVESLQPLLHRAPIKLLIFSQPEIIRELRDYWQPRLRGRANVLITADEYLEFMNPLVNKGWAVKMLMRRYGLGPQAVLAAGDGFNDLEMLRAAGVGVAVSNGRDELKLAAAHVVAPPAQDGLAAFLEEHFLG